MLNQDSTPNLPSLVLPSLVNAVYSSSGLFYQPVDKHRIIDNSVVGYAAFPKLAEY